MYIVSIKVEKRESKIPDVQRILTNYGEAIDTRLGVHTKDNQGLIIVLYNKQNINEIIEDLNGIEDIKVSFMEA